MYSHALFLSGGQHCKLCMQCLRSCPSHSPRLFCQAPLRDVWASDLIVADYAPLSLVAGLLAWLLAAGLAPQRPAAWSAWFAVACAAVAVLGLVLSRVVGGAGRAERGGRESRWARVLYAYAPAAGGLLLAFHLGEAPWAAEVEAHLVAGGRLYLGLSLLQALQVSAVVAGGLMTLWALWQLCCGAGGPSQWWRGAGTWLGLSAPVAAGLTTGLMLLQ
jgi:hypothetical protein